MTLGPSLRMAFRTLALMAKVQASGRAGSASSPSPPPPPPPPPPPAPATAFTLAGPASGTVDVASSFSVTPNGPLGGAATVNITAPGATLSTASLSFLSGATAGQTFTVTRATEGTTSVSITNTLGLTNSGSPISYTASAPVEAGTWQQLSYSEQTRKVITLAGTGGGAFDPTKALAVEAQSPIAVTQRPARGFSTPFLGERGTIYMVGGLHSNYQGNEIDKLILPLGASTEITGDFSHQPNMPPQGVGSGYGSGSGGYIYRQYDGGLADITDWQPYPGHQWTKSTWHPLWGPTSFTAHPLQSSYPNGTFERTKGRARSGVLSSGEQLLSNFDTITDGSFVYSKDGTPITVTGINLTTATTLTQVASLITAALSGATMTWRNGSKRFQLETSTTGAGGSISYLTAAGSGTDLGPLLKLRSTDGGTTLPGDLLVSSHAQPDDYEGDMSEALGVVGYDWETGKYKTYLTQYAAPTFDLYLLAETGISDYNEWDSSTIMLHTNSGQTRIKRYSQSGGLVELASTYQIGGYDGHGGNGSLIRHLEHRKFLILTFGGSGPALTRLSLKLYSEDFGSGDARFKTLTPPAGSYDGVPDGVTAWLTFGVDKSSRRVFWAVYPTQTAGMAWRFYISTFDDLMNWTPLSIDPDITYGGTPYEDAFLSARNQPMHFQGGYLYFFGGPDASVNPGFVDGLLTCRRAKIDGADLPAMTFKRYRYKDQDYHFGTDIAPYIRSELSYAKHVVWAYRTADDKHYNCGGDMGISFNATMSTLEIEDGTPRGYTFTQILNEIEPTADKRPVAPDDGAWFYSSSANPNVAFRDRFIYCRGGDGIGWNGNLFQRTAYAPFATDPTAWNGGSPDAGAQAAMEADGFTMDRLLVFNPDTTSFSELRPDLWPFDKGDASVNHPALIAANTARGAAFDVTTNCVFRFTNYSNSMWLVKYDLTNETIKGWNVSSWWDNDGLFGTAGRRWFLDGATPPADTPAGAFGHYSTGDERWHSAAAHAWEHKAYWIDETDGKLYVVSPQTGYLWCYETRGTESGFGSGGDGPTIPFYPVGERVPLVGCYPPMDSETLYPPVPAGTGGSTNNGSIYMNSYMVPFKGGILWWSSNHFDGGSFGHARHAFWRALGDAGKWTPVSFPQDLTAQSFSCKSLHRDNDEVILLHGGGTPHAYGYGEDSNYFWRLT